MQINLSLLIKYAHFKNAFLHGFGVDFIRVAFAKIVY